MYPFADQPEEQSYVRNEWYMAAWREEVTRQPMQRMLLGEPVVLFRKEDGSVAALWGLCPHRHHPLAGGQVQGDAIQCPYHGFTFDTAGMCTRVPSQERPPSGQKLKVYPVVETWEIVWIWMGDPSLADPATLPPLEDIGLGRPHWRAVPNGLTPIKARWSLIVDNLMDLSHIAFLHGSTLSMTALSESPPQYAESEGMYRVRRWMLDQNPRDAYQDHALPDNQKLLDGEVTTHFYGPNLLVSSQAFSTAASQGVRQPLCTVNHVHLLTPETAHSTHNFSAFARDVRLDDVEYDKWLSQIIKKTRAEDTVALEAIEAVVDRHADVRKELSGVGDAGALRVRRLLAERMRRELAESGEEGLCRVSRPAGPDRTHG